LDGPIITHQKITVKQPLFKLKMILFKIYNAQLKQKTSKVLTRNADMYAGDFSGARASFFARRSM
jgi:hypothetical protein